MTKEEMEQAVKDIHYNERTNLKISYEAYQVALKQFKDKATIPELFYVWLFYDNWIYLVICAVFY